MSKKKDLGIRPNCPDCNSGDIVSRDPDWHCKGCGHRWAKKYRPPRMKKSEISDLAPQNPVALLAPVKSVQKVDTEKTLIALFDAHLDPQEHIHPSFLIAKQFTIDIQPDIIIIGGDWGNFSSMSAWEKNKAQLMEGRRYRLEVELYRRELSDIRNACPKAEIHFFEGNHEYRVPRYLEEHPTLESLIDVRKDLGIDEMEMKWVPFNDIIRIGKMCYLHGTKWNKYYARSTLEIVGQSCMFGHKHAYQVWTQRLRFDQEPHIAIGVPSLSSQNPAWKRGELTDWMNGIGIVEYRPGGYFNANVLPIVGNQMSWGGRTWQI